MSILKSCTIQSLKLDKTPNTNDNRVTFRCKRDDNDEMVYPKWCFAKKKIETGSNTDSTMDEVYRKRATALLECEPTLKSIAVNLQAFVAKHPKCEVIIEESENPNTLQKEWVARDIYLAGEKPATMSVDEWSDED